MKQSLRDRILAYHQKNNGVWIASGEIQRLVTERTKFSPSNATRRLRELREDGLLEQKLVKGHAHYRYIPQRKTVQEVVIENDVARIVHKEIMV